MKKNRAGFTLVELLVVVAIIGTILSLSIISFNNVKTNSRDTKRISDIKQIQAALELYRANEGSYPDELALGQSLSSASTTYMKLVPSNQTSNQSSVCSGSNYTYAKEGNSYTLEFCLEKDSETLKEGVHCATSQGIKDGSCVPPFVCGTDSVVYGGESYPTVYIDNLGGHNLSLPGQCWFAKNLNVGAMVAGSANQVNTGTIEKYCYGYVQDGDAGQQATGTTNCNSQGGLYQWNEAMQYVTTEPNQGICPTGWHIPTDTEQNTLDQYLTDTACDANRSGWSCDAAGSKLSSATLNGNNSSGFAGPLPGYRIVDGLFLSQGSYMAFWSSSIIGSNAWYRRLGSDYSTVGRNADGQNFGFSVRCLKD